MLRLSVMMMMMMTTTMLTKITFRKLTDHKQVLGMVMIKVLKDSRVGWGYVLEI